MWHRSNNRHESYLYIGKNKFRPGQSQRGRCDRAASGVGRKVAALLDQLSKFAMRCCRVPTTNIRVPLKNAHLAAASVEFHLDWRGKYENSKQGVLAPWKAK